MLTVPSDGAPREFRPASSLLTIAHISDLHFSYTTAQLLSKLLCCLREARPRLVVVSGDLTQRARDWQFGDAQYFVESLPHPILVVPGNHDVPLWNVYARFFRPLSGYRKYICDDLMPVLDDEDLFVVGANSTRAFTFDPFGFWKNGSLSCRQLEEIRRRFTLAKPDALKVLVMHHPLINPWNGGSRDTARGRRRIIRAFQESGVDIVLSGHLHKAYAAHAMAVSKNGRRVMCIQAGTACSTRLRDEPNAFNLLHLEDRKLSLTIMRYNGTTFMPEEALPLI